MSHQKQIEILPNWERFATAKRWKKQLGIKSHTGELSQSTWNNARYWMPFLLLTSKLTPDELIEESLNDNEIGEDRLSECFRFAKKKRSLSHNSAITGVYGILRGFYSHNKISTQGWHSPRQQPKKVEQTDGDFPLFKKTKNNTLDLDRETLQRFFEKLNPRDKTIALCLISTGLDDGDLLKLNVGFVRNQNAKQKRLFLSNYRNKTLETIRVFFSKEATKKLREYVKIERSDAIDDDPLFVNTMPERKRLFRIKYKRDYRQMDYDLLPDAKPLTQHTLSQNFRRFSESLGIKIEKSQQSPLRPKRLRHVFRTACQLAGLGDDMARIFMGQKSQASKTYLPKSREELEQFYEQVEPFVSVFIERINEDEITKLRIEYETKIEQFKKGYIDFQDTIKKQIDEHMAEREKLQKQMDEKTLEHFDQSKKNIHEKFQKLKTNPKKLKQLKELFELLDSDSE